jgi:hypothetical protein
MFLNPRLLAVVAAALVATSGCIASESEPEATEASENSLTGVSYDSVVNLEGPALRTGLYTLIKGQRALGYDRARDAIFTNKAFLTNGKVECNYTGRLVSPDGSRIPGGFNTEHTWPQSLGAKSDPAKSDLHHLFPADGSANSARGNHPFGIAKCMHDATACTFEVGGSGLGKDTAGTPVFEVRNEKRGNVARAMFYFSVRYQLPIPEREETTLRAWHAEDPVDAPEMARNDAVEKLQNNRNPFVDHPEFVARITDF